MNTRIPLVAAVVGALLVGGATTGSTRASWVDTASRATNSVASGTMTLTGAPAPTSLTVTKGQTISTKVTATNSSPAAAKNLVQRITPTVSVVTTPAPAGGVSATMTTTNAGGTCTGTSQPAVSTTAGGAFTFCVNVSATAGTTATAATATVTLTGQQMRNGNPQGWSRTQTVTVPVTVVSPTPATPVLTCTEIGNDVRVTWTEVPGVTYTAEYSQNGTSGWTGLGQVDSPYVVTDLPWPTMFAHVRGTNAFGSSAWSSNLRLTETGNKIDCP